MATITTVAHTATMATVMVIPLKKKQQQQGFVMHLEPLEYFIFIFI